MTLNYLIVANAPFPEWDDALEADLTYIDKVHDADGWARVIFDHYRDADALITDLAPIWSDVGNPGWIDGLNGINAVRGAKENALPSFVYTPFVSEPIVNAAYRDECNAVVNSYKYSVNELKEIIDTTISKEKDDPERIWIDTKYLPQNISNLAIAATDETLSALSEAETSLFLKIVGTESYDEAAKASGYKTGSLRNKASEIFQKCGFKNKSRASIHAVRIGISGVV